MLERTKQLEHYTDKVVQSTSHIPNGVQLITPWLPQESLDQLSKPYWESFISTCITFLDSWEKSNHDVREGFIKGSNLICILNKLKSSLNLTFRLKRKVSTLIIQTRSQQCCLHKKFIYSLLLE